MVCLGNIYIYISTLQKGAKDDNDDDDEDYNNNNNNNIVTQECMYMKIKTQTRAVMCEAGSLDIANFICQLINAFIMKEMVDVKHNHTAL
jgi:hypothetical protein